MIGTFGFGGRWVLGLALWSAAVLAGCSGGATQAPNSGFLEDSARMTTDQRMPFQRTYWNKAYDSKAYTELYVAPVNTDYVMAQSFWEKANVANVDPAKAKKDIAAVAE